MQLNTVASNGIKIAYRTFGAPGRSATAAHDGAGQVAAPCSAMAASLTLPPPLDALRGPGRGIGGTAGVGGESRLTVRVASVYSFDQLLTKQKALAAARSARFVSL